MSDLALDAEALAALALALEPVTPPAGMRDRLLAAARGAGRLRAFAERVAQLIDVSREAAAAMLDAVDEASPWTAGPSPGSQLFHLAPGPACTAADVGFVRIAAGMPFPRHEHLAREHVLVLEGGYREDDGTLALPGSEHVREAGSVHSFVALPGHDLVFLVILAGGLRIEGYEDYRP